MAALAEAKEIIQAREALEIAKAVQVGMGGNAELLRALERRAQGPRETPRFKPGPEHEMAGQEKIEHLMKAYEAKHGRKRR